MSAYQDKVDILIQQITEKQAELQVLKKELKALTPFKSTKFGKLYFSSLEAMTRPFAKLNTMSQEMLASDVPVNLTALLLEEARAIAGPSDPLASVLVEELAARALFDNVSNTEREAIRHEIERLRSEEDKQRVSMLLEAHGMKVNA